MELSTDEALQALEQLRLPEETRVQCGQLVRTCQYDELYVRLRGERTEFLNHMHAAQEQLDRLDRLIYDVKKKREDV